MSVESATGLMAGDRVFFDGMEAQWTGTILEKFPDRLVVDRDDDWFKRVVLVFSEPENLARLQLIVPGGRR